MTDALDPKAVGFENSLLEKKEVSDVGYGPYARQGARGIASFVLASAGAASKE